MSELSLDAPRLLDRLHILGDIGRDTAGRLTRLAGSDHDRAGRDQLVAWLEEAGLEVAIDRIGNIFGIWSSDGNALENPVLLGSHIDTVIDAGIYDGCYGVLAGLAVIETLKTAGLQPVRPIVVAAFTNEEGVRYAPDMMGSLVFSGGMTAEEALAAMGTDGTVLGDELRRIGYAGEREPGFLTPHAYIELHIEQGPILEREGSVIGAVENLQGISWQRLTIDGVANHAGTTPMSMRRDAGHAAARVVTFLRDRAAAAGSSTVATVGCMQVEPNAINVIPSRASLTVDLRDPDAQKLRKAEVELETYLRDLATIEGVQIAGERLARFEPVVFDTGLVERIETAAKRRNLANRRMTSGAGHDAQMISRIAPAAMIFVPSVGGISHNPAELTTEAHLAAGATILLDVVMDLVIREAGESA